MLDPPLPAQCQRRGHCTARRQLWQLQKSLLQAVELLLNPKAGRDLSVTAFTLPACRCQHRSLKLSLQVCGVSQVRLNT